jgi:hypothetical protein
VRSSASSAGRPRRGGRTESTAEVREKRALLRAGDILRSLTPSGSALSL